jgi:outer membrane immunogenic protein
MNFRKAFVGAAMLSLSAAPAFGQHFDGPYAGVQAGWERAEVRDTANLPVIPGLDEDQSAFTGGLFVGYDRQVAPRVVVGAEAGMDFSSYDSIQGSNAAGQFSIDPQWSLDLTARAGYLVNPRTLVYARGGYENARIETSALIGGSRIEDSENHDGWTLGAGVEQQLLQNISGRLEYRYSDLSDGDGTQDRHRLLAGIAYRF